MQEIHEVDDTHVLQYNGHGKQYTLYVILLLLLLLYVILYI